MAQLLSTRCSCEGQGSAPSTHMVIQPSIIPASWDLVPSSNLHKHQTHTWPTVLHANKTLTHIKWNQIHFKKYIS